MIQINPREVAAEAMVQILAEGAYNNTALRRLLRQNGAMSQQDRAFVTEIVNGTLRNIYYVAAGGTADSGVSDAFHGCA